MRITVPTIGQSALSRLLGVRREWDSDVTIEEAVACARRSLVNISNYGTSDIDFGYDPRAWYAHLLETDDGNFRFGNGHLHFPELIETVTADPSWRRAVGIAAEVELMEFVDFRKLSREYARWLGNEEWSGEPRACPACATVFTSVQDYGHCPNCRKRFFASHPHDDRFWEHMWVSWEALLLFG